MPPRELAGPEETVFSPNQASSLAVASVKNRQTSADIGIKTGITSIDKIMLPMRPGELITVIGFTSNYKSGLMTYIAKSAEHQLVGPEDIVVYISWEQSVEEQTILGLAHLSLIDASKLYKGEISEYEWKKMMDSAVKRASSPLWLIGHSEANEKRRPRLSMTDVGIALSYVVDVHKKRPALVVLDYLQRINRVDSRSADIRVGFIEIVDRSKDLALAFHCPVLLGTQAGRQVLDRKWKQPSIADSSETSNLEQSSDKVLSVWLPKTSEPPNSQLRYGSMEFAVNDNLLLVHLLKQRYGLAPYLFALHVKPEVNQIFPLLPEDEETDENS